MYDQKLIADYFRKCFFSVDGLWFMTVEADADFEKALELDVAVWSALPKIQARTIQALISCGSGIDALQQAVAFKLNAELFSFDISQSGSSGFALEVRDCPWVCQIKASNRLNILERIADEICSLEYRTFAREFGDGIVVEHECNRCPSSGCCRLIFRDPAGCAGNDSVR